MHDAPDNENYGNPHLQVIEEHRRSSSNPSSAAKAHQNTTGKSSHYALYDEE